MPTSEPFANLWRRLTFAILAFGILHTPSGAAESNSRYAVTTSNFNLPVPQIERSTTGDRYIDALLYQGDIERIHGRKDQAGADYRLALSWMQLHSERNNSAIAETLWLLASLIEQDDPLAAATDLADAIAALHSYPPAEPLLIGIKRARAAFLIAAHDFAGAEAMAREAYHAAKQSKGDLDPLTIESLQILTAALHNQTKYGESRKCGLELLRTAEQAFGEHHWEIARAQAFIGASDVAEHRYEEALPELGKAISIWNEYPNHPADEYEFANSNLIEAEMALKRKLGAEGHARR